MADFSDLNQNQMQIIRDAILGKQYYLITGSGSSLDSEGKRGQILSASDLKNKLCDIVGVSHNKTLQQAYSLLDPGQIEENLTNLYTCTIPGKTAKKILSYSWRRRITFNIDNCLEVAARALAELKQDPDPAFHFRNFVDDFSDTSPEILLDVVHLHGFVEQPEAGYVFSHLDYAKNINRANSWMLALTQLIRVEPFLIIGTTLEEIDVTYYLEQRNFNSTRSDIAPSILIEPYPDRLTEKLCRDHEFFLFRGSALEFFSQLERAHGDSPGMWPSSFSDGLGGLNLAQRERVAFTSTFETVPKAHQPDGRVAPFLLGSPATWASLDARADIDRNVSTSLQAEIGKYVKKGDYRVFLLLDEIGSGKTSLLMRLAINRARTDRNVYYFTGNEIISPDRAASIISRVEGFVFLFADNWADHQAYFIEFLANLDRGDVIIVASERSYRRAYIEDALADEDIAIVQSQLDLDDGEARRLIEKFEGEGIASDVNLGNGGANKLSKKLIGDTISIAACRIQNNYYAFDQIVARLLNECSQHEVNVYATVAISRFCYSNGVSRSILFEAQPSKAVETLTEDFSRLPITYSPYSRQYLVPARTAIAERVLVILRQRDQSALAQIFIELAIALAPHVNRKQIRARTPAAKLAGALMDFDRLVRRFINPHAEQFYESIKDHWAWNSRYWEQRALLKLDRYLLDRSDKKLLQEGIQNARYAYSLEHHPLSLTTLAKMLFAAMELREGDFEVLFDEAWNLILESIEIESKWTNIKATAFVVCFRGVITFVENGGRLSGSQAEKIRDIISITYSRRLRGGGLSDFREKVAKIIAASG